MGITLRTLGLIGILLFGALFSLTFASPEAIEESAKGFIKYQIEKEVREKYQTLKQSTLGATATKFAERLVVEQDQLQQSLDDNLPEKIASVVATMCRYDCERKKALSQSIASSYLDRIKSLEVAQDNLGNIVKNKYLEIVAALKLDLRIFLGINCLMFAILLLVSLLKPQAIVHLFLPGILLFVSTLISSYCYLFYQDWFYTILYNNYIGFGYLVYIALIFGFLMDVTFNCGRVTAEILNACLSAFGSALQVLPC